MVKNIQTFIELHETLRSELNKKFSERYGVLLEEVILMIEKSSVDISNQLKKQAKLLTIQRHILKNL